MANSLYMLFLVVLLKSPSRITKITLHRRCFIGKLLDLLDRYFFFLKPPAFSFCHNHYIIIACVKSLLSEFGFVQWMEIIDNSDVI